MINYNIQHCILPCKLYLLKIGRLELPPTSLQPVYLYENILESSDASFEYTAQTNESAPAGMCYTSATTGNPNGVVYSHRGIYLHSLSIGITDSLDLSERDTVMPIVPMFHINAWGLPFASVWFGSKQVLPGPMPTPYILLRMIEEEKVTIAAGVPTVWTAALKVQEAMKADLTSLRAVICGGSAAPRSLIECYEQNLKVPFYHAYGMTETYPLVTIACLKSYQREAPLEEPYKTRATQGLLVPRLDMKNVGPREGFNQERRRMDLLTRFGKRFNGSSQRVRSLCDRGPSSEMGRTSSCICHVERCGAASWRQR
ncbi:AMP-binding protein [Paenibacillus sedimenti]|uniref:AMP-binding protein n=1 Tax=Paenibacillus sedimenti TaxID=2770274 RepID=UPI00289872ED|nr:AMP-binding protein [Paenibacillus sedimenti]